MQRTVEYIAALEPFDRLEPDLLLRVSELVMRVEFDAQAWLVRQGTEPDGSLLILVEGRAVIVAGTDGDERVVGNCQPGDFAGLSGALTGEPHPVGVRADVPTPCLRVPKEAVDLCLTSPGFAAFFSRTLARRLRRTYTEFTREHDFRHGGLDTQPFRARVSELMQAPVVTGTLDLSVGALARLMHNRGVSSVVIVSEGEPAGIVTAADLVGKVLARDLPPVTAVQSVMTSPVATVSSQAFYYEALLRMVRGGFKHLPVVDSDARLVGMVTLGDLARTRAEGALSVVDQIEREQTVAGLATVVIRIDAVLRSLVNEGWQPSQVLPVITELNDRLTRRLIDLAFVELGKPPCDWCWLHLGSAGREEQFTRSDQDNALIYVGPPDEVDRYFKSLATFVVDGLEQCGFARCPGDVMATNKAWRRSLSDWRFHVISMVGQPDPEQIRLATIFLDLRAVAGNPALAASLREQVWVAVESLPIFLFHLVRDDLAHTVTPLRGEHKGQINLKTEVAVHVVDLIRALAVKHRVPETSTLGRMRALIRAGSLGKDEGEWLEIAYQTLMRIRMQDAIARMHIGEPPSHFIQVSQLSEPERAALKDALVAVARLQEWVGAALAPGGAHR